MYQRLLDIIERETYGEIYRGHQSMPSIEEDTGNENDSSITRIWQRSAEPSQTKRYIDLSRLSKEYISGNEQILTYFLDGSRRIIKAGEIAYRLSTGGRRIIYPVMAGQIGVGCCRRVNKKLIPEKIKHEIVIALPDMADSDGRNSGFIEAVTLKLSQSDIMRKLNLEVAKILKYTTGKDSFAQDKGTAAIQSRMLEQEQELTESLTRQRKLNQDNFLIKDGSLEYVRKTKSNSLANYRWVIGISKSFNPELCKDNQGKPDSGYIANLPVNHRTQAAIFSNPAIMGDCQFAIWYIRLHDRTRTASAFDGIIKVEKMLVTESEVNNGLDSAFIDTLSAYIINEKCPVCYGKDKRWASHIYPVYLTESYIKSRYISTESFINLF